VLFRLVLFRLVLFRPALLRLAPFRPVLLRLALLRADFFGAALRVLFREAPFRAAFLVAPFLDFRADFPDDFADVADFRVDFFGAAFRPAPEDLRPEAGARSRRAGSSRAVLGAGGSAGEVVGVGAGAGPGGYSIGRGSIQPDPDQPISI
jgi:hypothetical protein